MLTLAQGDLHDSALSFLPRCVVNAQILALGGPNLKPWYCMSPKSVIIPECGLHYITNGVRVGTNRPYHVISRCFGVSWQACGTRWHREKLRDFPDLGAIKPAAWLDRWCLFFI